MIKNFHIIIIKKRTLILSLACFFCCILFINICAAYLQKKDPSIITNANSDYVIIAANDLGMHCYQSDYAAFLILPPGNNLCVQVFHKEGNEVKLVNSGIEIYYNVIDNTTSADKINFWEYAKDYGYDILPNIGITGNGMSGKMKLSEDKKYYIATAIPVTPYNDGSTELNPYQLAKIWITDNTTGKELASVDNIVVPVSDEMDCYICHGKENTSLNILKAHDDLSGTHLAAELEQGNRYKCSTCHEDNILDDPGKPGVLSLSEAMHGFHAGKAYLSDVEPVCYSCHPGPITQCYRGIMSIEGIGCINPECHGDMSTIAQSLAEGREAWLQEPDCSSCHNDKYEVNPNTLYRNSYLINNINPEMNDKILCTSCHNGPHAEWKSKNPIDNLLPLHLQGLSDFIKKCSVCHEENQTGTVHGLNPK